MGSKKLVRRYIIVSRSDCQLADNAMNELEQQILGVRYSVLWQVWGGGIDAPGLPPMSPNFANPIIAIDCGPQPISSFLHVKQECNVVWDWSNINFYWWCLCCCGNAFNFKTHESRMATGQGGRYYLPLVNIQCFWRGNSGNPGSKEVQFGFKVYWYGIMLNQHWYILLCWMLCCSIFKCPERPSFTLPSLASQ